MKLHTVQLLFCKNKIVTSRNVLINSKKCKDVVQQYHQKMGTEGRKLMGKKGPHRYHVTVKDAVIWVIQISVLGHDTVLVLYDELKLILTSKELFIIS